MEGKLKIAIVGSGFVGQATGKGLAKHGHDITFVDVDQTKVDQLKSDGYKALISNDFNTYHDIIMLTLPTPTINGKIVLDYIKEAASRIGMLLRKKRTYTTVVVRSTVPPGTTNKLITPIIETTSARRAGRDFGIAMQPEFLRQVSANEDFERPWHIVIGSDDQSTGNLLENIYRPFNSPIDHMSIEEAEMQKYVHNLYNANKIAFLNEMRAICNKEGWDADKVLLATAQSCEAIWNPIYGLRDFGPFDGACLPKDTAAFLDWCRKRVHSAEILSAIISQNNNYAIHHKQQSNDQPSTIAVKKVRVPVGT